MKIIFSKPKKDKILIFDTYNNEANLILKNKEYGLFDIRGESTNLYIVYLSLLNLFFNFNLYLKIKNIKQFYILNYLKFVSPRFVITTSDFNFFFFRLKNLIPSIKFIVIQSGLRSKSFYKEFKNYRKKYYLSVDYFFCHSEVHISFLKRIVRAKFLAIGRIHNNEIIKKKKNFKKRIIFISEARSDFLKKIDNRIDFKRRPEFYIFEIIKNFFFDKRVELIFLSKQPKTKKKIFLNYFKYKKIKFSNSFKNIKDKMIYINSSYMIIFISSTLGYEGFSKKIKTVCLPFDSKKKRLEQLKQFMPIGYPLKFSKDGPFWTNSVKKKVIENKIKYIYNLPKKKWIKIYERYKFLFPFYPLNNKIKLILDKILKVD